VKKEFKVDDLNVYLFDTREEMGKIGAIEAAGLIRSVYETNGVANIIFASSPSQLDVLGSLIIEDVDWGRVNAFHMDEYIGLGIEHASSFANYIRNHFFSKITLKNAFYMNGKAEDIQKECERYSELLEKYPTDITFGGIGENGHMAFNDPEIADFFESKLMKVNTSLDALCRQQQVNDGWFAKLDDVPDSALTVTFPAMLRARYLFITSPGKSKSEIIAKCLEGAISREVPASVIRLHNNARLYIDIDSASQLTNN